MKSKILFLGGLILVGLLVVPCVVLAQTAVVKDIIVDSKDNSVKISITSNKTLQIETFKNEESPANYIVLDFLGTVYTNLPSIIKVNKGPVEKVSLVKGEVKAESSLGTDYYPLDFLAINLSKAAEYRIDQSQSVIDLSIGSSGVLTQATDTATVEKAVELTPPIVISKEKNREQESTAQQQEVRKVRRVRKDTSKPETSSSIAGERKLRRVETQATAQTSKPVVTNISSGSERRRVRVDASETKVAAKEVVTRKEPPAQTTSLRSTNSQELIDQIVSDTIREKEKTSSRIDTLTYELKKLQEELSLSKGQKSMLDEKINQILAKLDELQSALDDEIRRRQALGEAVEDLITRRERYQKARQVYEELSARLAQISEEVDKMSTEVESVKNKFTEAQTEKKRLENEVNSMETRYNQLKDNYEKITQVKDAVSEKIDKIVAELEKLKKELERSVDEKDQIISRMKQLENESKSSGIELSRLQQLIADRNVTLLELEGSYKRLKAALDSTVSEKEKIESAYNNSKSEFERIKKEIEEYLKDKVKN